MSRGTLLLAAALLCAAGPAAAFKPGSPKADGDQTHASITRIALRPLYQELLDVPELTPAMEMALDEIVRANRRTDLYFLSSARHHCDAESIVDAHLLIRDQVNRIAMATALAPPATGTARTALGEALHTLQDFYSHSNWIELGRTAPSPVGSNAPAALNTLVQMIAGPSGATCAPCEMGLGCCAGNAVGERLTSGYFDFLTPLKPPFKCSHGGPFDLTRLNAPEGGLNKDTSTCTESPHASQHAAAASLAVVATRQFVREVAQSLASAQLRALLGADTLRITNTNGVSAGQLQLTLDARSSTSVVLAAGQSVDVTVPDLSHISDHTLEVRGLFSQSSTGLLAYTIVLPSHLELVRVLSDRDGVMELRGRQFTDVLVLNPPTPAGRHRTSLFTIRNAMPARSAARGAAPLAPAGRLAVASPTRHDGRGAEPSGAARAVDLLDVVDSLAGGMREVPLAVDGTMSNLVIEVDGPVAVELERPDGSTVLAGDPGVELNQTAAATSYAVAQPIPGRWLVRLEGAGDYGVRASGHGSVDLVRFELGRSEGRPGHEGVFAVPGDPAVGAALTAVATLTGPVAEVSFELRSAAGEVRQAFTLQADGGAAPGELAGAVVLPDGLSRVYAVGTDVGGAEFQRLWAAPVVPRTVVVEPPLPVDLPPGQIVRYEFRVINSGPADDFSIAAEDDAGFVMSVEPGELTLEADAEGTVAVALDVPASAPQGSAHVLRVEVRGADDAGANAASVISAVFALPPATPTASRAPTEAATPTPSPTAVAPPTPTVTAPTATGSEAPTASPTPTPSDGAAATATAGASATPTDLPSPSAGPEETPTTTPSSGPNDSPTAVLTRTPEIGGCAGDCDGSGSTAVNELVLAVNIALGSAPVGTCPAADLDGDGEVTIAELISAVQAALAGCGGSVRS